MGIVAETCKKTLVLYAGKVMEYGLTRDIFQQPSHPYTIGLLEAMPRLDIEYEILKTIPGNPPNMMEVHHGCPFWSRCPSVIDKCSNIPPILEVINKDTQQQRACHVPFKDLQL